MEDREQKAAWWLALRIFDEPTRVFQSLAARPRATLPLLLIVLVSAVGALGTPRAVLEEGARRQAVSLRSRAPDRFTEEDVQRMIDRAGTLPTRTLLLGGNIVFALVILTVVALLLMLIFGTTAAEPVKFADEFAIVTHAYLPQLLGMILTVVLMRLGAAGFETPGANPLSLGFLFDPEQQPFLHRFASFLTLFGAWNVFLLALGNQVKTRGKSLTGPLVIVGGLWVLANVGLAAFAGLFTVS
jgi:hypothetical protein